MCSQGCGHKDGGTSSPGGCFQSLKEAALTDSSVTTSGSLTAVSSFP